MVNRNHLHILVNRVIRSAHECCSLLGNYRRHGRFSVIASHGAFTFTPSHWNAKASPLMALLKPTSQFSRTFLVLLVPVTSETMQNQHQAFMTDVTRRRRWISSEKCVAPNYCASLSHTHIRMHHRSVFTVFSSVGSRGSCGILHAPHTYIIIFGFCQNFPRLATMRFQ